MMLQEGDIVNDMRSTTQWANARSGFDYLDGKLPFVAAAGNHDEEILSRPPPGSNIRPATTSSSPASTITTTPATTGPVTIATPTACSQPEGLR